MGNVVVSPGSNIANPPIILGKGVNILRTALGEAGDAVEATLASVVIPAGLMGSDGVIVMDIAFAPSASTQDKTLGVYVAGLALGAPVIPAANTRGSMHLMASMAGANNVIESLNNGVNPYASGTGAFLTRTIDMTVDQTLTITQKWAAAATPGNTFRIMFYTITVYPGTV